MELGIGELLFIFVLALLLFGPKRLPEIGRQIASALNQFKAASNEFKSQLESEVQKLEVDTEINSFLHPAQGAIEALKQGAMDMFNSPPQSVSRSTEVVPVVAAEANTVAALNSGSNVAEHVADHVAEPAAEHISGDVEANPVHLLGDAHAVTLESGAVELATAESADSAHAPAAVAVLPKAPDA